MRKLLLSAPLFLAALMLAGASARTQPIPTAPQTGEQSQEAMKSVAGTVVSIGDKGHSFALEVNEGGKKQTLQFVVDQETRVNGQVKVGSPVKVEYVAKAEQKLAKSITPQTQGQRLKFLNFGELPKAEPWRRFRPVRDPVTRPAQDVYLHGLSTQDLWDEEWLRKRLQVTSARGYENEVSAVVAKLLIKGKVE